MGVVDQVVAALESKSLTEILHRHGLIVRTAKECESTDATLERWSALMREIKEARVPPAGSFLDPRTELEKQVEEVTLSEKHLEGTFHPRNRHEKRKLKAIAKRDAVRARRRR